MLLKNSPVATINKVLISITFFSFFILLLNGCEESDPIQPATEITTGTVTDAEGNVYKTVKIGNQWWMAENLRATKFRNGNLIYQVQSIADWATANSAYCIYDNNDRSPGLLYNYNAVADTNKIA